MIERYIQITCDACSETDWSQSNETMSEFKAARIFRWKHRGRKALYPQCVARGVKWSQAVLFEAANGMDDSLNADATLHAFKRTPAGMSPLDHVLGGGLVEASVVLLAGPHGIGVSLLALQMLGGVGRKGLYVSGDMMSAAVEEMSQRIGVPTPHLSVISERNLEMILDHARAVEAKTIVVDSIRDILCKDVNGRCGSPAQIKECIERLCIFAKKNAVAIWILGHVPRVDDIAGPETIKQIIDAVDAVLVLTRGVRLDGAERILRCYSKNRFGTTYEIGHFELTVNGFVPVRP